MMGPLVSFAMAAALAGSAAGSPTAHSGPERACLRVLLPQSAGAIPDSGAFEPASCAAAHSEETFHYDSTDRVTRLSRTVAAGEIVNSFPEFQIGIVRPGDKLTLISRVGSVDIERKVQALQPARPGERLFVKSSDGTVLSARFEAAAP